ncbi:NAD kinase [Rhodococcus sp. CH91]|uniref:NAD kinase n=1 Tax=Rhodococcus sp. CH91 TaxID=2910256 RepID=UPI001F4A13EA|nr:NAD kinase [Rhodococcus sp. CH91]
MSTETVAGDATRSGREILLVSHSGRDEIAGTAMRVAKILGEAGIGLRTLDDEAVNNGLGVLALPGSFISVVEPGPEAAAGCEMVIVLGGDGSFLRAAELAQYAAVPVLGINLGRIGFLAESEADHLEEALMQVVHREYRIEQRMTLDVTVRLDDEILDRGWALNEASLENKSRLGVLEVVLEVDGRPVSSFGCDGVLVATPTGSTAYAFSAGGPIVWPELEALLVIPSNAHALFARPLVTSPESIIAVETLAGGHDGVVFCDGRRTLEVPAGARLEVVRGCNPVRWVRLDSAPFADRMVRKFELPVKGWRGRKL